MKYRLKKDLPFMKVGTFFKKVQDEDRFATNNTTWTYGAAESAILNSILRNTDWVEEAQDDEPLTVCGLIELLENLPQKDVIRCGIGGKADTVNHVGFDPCFGGHVLITNKGR